MSLAATNAVHAYSKAKGTARTVLLVIAHFVNDLKNSVAWPSLQKIAECSNMSIRQVQRLINKLVELGELQVIPNQGTKGTNLYKVLLPMSNALRSRDNGNSTRFVTPDTRVRGDICGAGDLTNPALSATRNVTQSVRNYIREREHPSIVPQRGRQVSRCSGFINQWPESAVELFPVFPLPETFHDLPRNLQECLKGWPSHKSLWASQSNLENWGSIFRRPWWDNAWPWGREQVAVELLGKRLPEKFNGLSREDQQRVESLYQTKLRRLAAQHRASYGIR